MRSFSTTLCVLAKQHGQDPRTLASALQSHWKYEAIRSRAIVSMAQRIRSQHAPSMIAVAQACAQKHSTPTN